VTYSLTEEQKNILKRYGEKFPSWLMTEDGKQKVNQHKQHEHYFKKELSKENLERISEKDFIKIFENLWALSGWRNKEWNIKEKMISKKPFSELRKDLVELLYGSDDFMMRYDQFRNKVSGIGLSMISEILNMIYPEKFCIWNEITRKVLKFIQLIPPEKFFQKNTLTGEQYSQCINFMNLIRSELKQYGIDDYIDLDIFIWKIHENDLPMKSRKDDQELRNNKNTIWVVRAGRGGQQEKDALENDVITIGWNEVSDLSSIKNKNDLREHYKKTLKDRDSYNQISQYVGEIWSFIKEIRIGDLVLLPLLSTKTQNIAICRVVGGYEYKEITNVIKHIRKVQWLHKAIPISEFDNNALKSFRSGRTIYSIRHKDIMHSILNTLEKYKVPLPFKDFGLNEDNIDEQEIKPTLTISDVARQTYFPIETIKEIEELLLDKNQIIFYGPPGTSKTFLAKKFSEYFTQGRENTTIVQFHQSYSYEDFMEGIKPNLSETGESKGFFRQPGLLKNLVRNCKSNPDKRIVLIIDEINRGNISKIFGELIYLLEYRNEKIPLTYSPQEEFFLPDNLYLIGTMNSADRSIAFVDYALRRRFYFVDFYPDSNMDVLSKWLEKNTNIKIDREIILGLLQEINIIISEHLGREYQIGYSYFMTQNLDVRKLGRIRDYAIMPLIQQYFFGKNKIVKDIQNIFKKYMNSSEVIYSQELKT
jgi:hypothetical protein